MAKWIASLINVYIFAIVAVSLAAQTLASNKTDWYGLGVNECFGGTCKFGQYCSKAMFLGGHCRDCDEMTVWCDTDREHLKAKMPSCFYICLQRDVEQLQAQLEGERNTTTPLQTKDAGGYVLDTLHYVLGGVIVLLLVALGVSLLLICRRKHRNPRLLLCKTSESEDLDVRHGSEIAPHDPDTTVFEPSGSQLSSSTIDMTNNNTAHNNDNSSNEHVNDSGRSSLENISVTTRLLSTSDCPSREMPHTPTQVMDEGSNAAIYALHAQA